jgi:hypothetical protein
VREDTDVREISTPGAVVKAAVTAVAITFAEISVTIKKTEIHWRAKAMQPFRKATMTRREMKQRIN